MAIKALGHLRDGSYTIEVHPRTDRGSEGVNTNRELTPQQKAEIAMVGIIARKSVNDLAASLRPRIPHYNELPAPLSER